jgi:hypothetical protein
MILAIDSLPRWERDLLRQAQDAQANEGQLYRKLTDKFESSRRIEHSSRTQQRSAKPWHSSLMQLVRSRRPSFNHLRTSRLMQSTTPSGC